jgi:hypothetical protein
MDSVTNYPQGGIKAGPVVHHRAHRLRLYYSLLSLLTALGVLAFIFSTISPEDDAIQQDCRLSSKSKQYALAKYKTVSDLRTFLICTVRSALAPPTQRYASYMTASVFFIPADEIKGIVCSSKTGDRSPPRKSS